ncbi:hypothetical protein [Rhodanobacter sp. L36]|uniref:hypothetical protein n=1 Tax=Rhodanobacter sp. L36 TaxID=1747221 RepID=UPI00131BEF98|nr:hypothetical protein [Rhodanobacter sp. L36]
MNDESFDELIALYRKVARETSSVHIDDRILEFSTRTRRRGAQLSWQWFAAAAASFAALWLTIHALQPHPAKALAATAETVQPGWADGVDRAYLLQMDVTPASSPVAQYLMHETEAPRKL